MRPTLVLPNLIQEFVAVNPNVKEKVIPKPEELIKIIENSQIKINEGLKKLKEIN